MGITLQHENKLLRHNVDNLRATLYEIKRALNHEWSADTLEIVAEIMCRNGYTIRPHQKREIPDATSE